MICLPLDALTQYILPGISDLFVIRRMFLFLVLQFTHMVMFFLLCICNTATVDVTS